MTSRIDHLYGIRIHHSTWGFLRFFVEHINLVTYDKDLKIIKDISGSRPDEIVLYLRDEISACKEFRSFIKDKVNEEFNLTEKISQLKVEYETNKKNNVDPNLTNEKMVKHLGIQIGEASKKYRSLLKETQDREFNRSYHITLKFYEDVGNRTFHLNYTHDLDKFAKDIFDFFNSHHFDPIVFAGKFGIFETYGKFPGGGNNKEDESSSKFYTICDKSLGVCDYKPLGNLIKEWIKQDRLSSSTSLEKISISF